eukprot:GAHX01005096.1.p2 GENE.GAHX01005096.1~~GAHX01005096.1.p2  ORF type:complete len:68 (+),score=6.82 GAHX01005096.1:125-328(+)
MQDTIAETVFQYRCTPHSTTEIAPFTAMFDRPMRDMLALLYPSAGKALGERKKIDIEKVNQKAGLMK